MKKGLEIDTSIPNVTFDTIVDAPVPPAAFVITTTLSISSLVYLISPPANLLIISLAVSDIAFPTFS